LNLEPEKIAEILKVPINLVRDLLKDEKK